MKISILIITSLISTTVGIKFAKLPKYPLGFFAKIGDSYLPLAGSYYESNGVKMNMLAHGTPSRFPVEFVLKNKQAFANITVNSGPAGLWDGALVFGPTISPKTFEFDSDMMIKKLFFRSCELIGTKSFVLFYEPTPLPVRYCVDVGVYLLPFDRYTGQVVKNVPFANDPSVRRD